VFAAGPVLIRGGDDVNLSGTVAAGSVDVAAGTDGTGSVVSTIYGSLMATGTISLAAGSGQGDIRLFEQLFDNDELGNLVDATGRFIDADGYLIDESASFIDANGDPSATPVLGLFLDENGRRIDAAGYWIGADGGFVDINGDPSVTPVLGLLLDENARRIDADGYLIDAVGYFVDANGALLVAGRPPVLGLLRGSISTTAAQELVAGAGRILHSGGVIGAQLLYTRSWSGLVANTSVAGIDAEVAGAGSIVFVNSGDVTLENLRTADGAISVRCFGSIAVHYVSTLGATDGNDITLTTYAGDLIFAEGDSIQAVGAGDVTLDILGAVDQVDASLIAADHVHVLVAGGAALRTQVGSLTLATTEAGDVSVTETDGLELTDVTVLDGSLSVTAGGDLTAGMGASTDQHGRQRHPTDQRRRYSGWAGPGGSILQHGSSGRGVPGGKSRVGDRVARGCEPDSGRRHSRDESRGCGRGPDRGRARAAGRAWDHRARDGGQHPGERFYNQRLYRSVGLRRYR
jgi:hypothetical protein